MRYIIAFLLTVALLCFSIVTGRAEQPTELPSGTYYLSFTSKVRKDDELKNLPVRLTTKIKTQSSASSGDRTNIVTDIGIESDDLLLAKEHDTYRSETERFKWVLTNQRQD